MLIEKIKNIYKNEVLFYKVLFFFLVLSISFVHIVPLVLFKEKIVQDAIFYYLPSLISQIMFNIPIAIAIVFYRKNPTVKKYILFSFILIFIPTLQIFNLFVFLLKPIFGEFNSQFIRFSITIIAYIFIVIRTIKIKSLHSIFLSCGIFMYLLINTVSHILIIEKYFISYYLNNKYSLIQKLEKEENQTFLIKSCELNKLTCISEENQFLTNNEKDLEFFQYQNIRNMYDKRKENNLNFYNMYNNLMITTNYHAFLIKNITKEKFVEETAPVKLVFTKNNINNIYILDLEVFHHINKIRFYLGFFSIFTAFFWFSLTFYLIRRHCEKRNIQRL